MKKRNAILVDFQAPEDWEFRKGIIEGTKEEWDLITLISNRNHGSIINNLIRYIKYFFLPFRIVMNYKKYDKIIAWQQFYGIILAFYFKLFHMKKSIKLVVMTFIYAPKPGLHGKLYEYMVKIALRSKYIDKCIVYSSSESKFYSDFFGVDINKFELMLFSIDDDVNRFEKILNEKTEKPYFLAAGRSNRDYKFLIELFKNIDCELKIISDELKDPKVDNITLYKSVYGDEYLELLAQSYGVLIALEDATVSSGLFVLLQSMMFSKPVISSVSDGLCDYITPGVTGLQLYKDIDLWINAIEEMLNNEEVYRKYSYNARQLFENKHSMKSNGIRMGNIMNELQ